MDVIDTKIIHLVQKYKNKIFKSPTAKSKCPITFNKLIIYWINQPCIFIVGNNFLNKSQELK